MKKSFAIILGLIMVFSLVPALTVSAAPAAPDSYTPRNRAMFNIPYGPGKQRHRINDTIDRAINSTASGETIRVSMYSFARPRTAAAMAAAHRRGVNVRMVLNDHAVTDATRYLRGVLGTNINNRSFVTICKRGCRTQIPGTQHAKFVAFTAVNGVRDVVMTTSGNLTFAGGSYQWNDMLEMVRKPTLHAVFAQVFDELARDKGLANPYRRVASGGYLVEFFPGVRGQLVDPFARTLDKVKCRGATQGAGRKGRTVIRIAMWTWRGERGMRLARKLRQLDNAGCHVEVIVGAPANNVLRELRRPGRYGGIKVRDSRAQYIPNYGYRAAHQKYMLINGRYGNDRNHWRVITGTMNLTPDALDRVDEFVIHKASRSLYFRYSSDNFQLMWNRYSRPLRNY